jgi:hypothetical protein
VHRPERVDPNRLSVTLPQHGGEHLAGVRGELDGPIGETAEPSRRTQLDIRMHGNARHARANGVGLGLGTDDVERARCEDGDDRTGVVRPGRGRVAGEVGDDTLTGRDERVAASVCEIGAEDGVATPQLCFKFKFETVDAQQLGAPLADCGHCPLSARWRWTSLPFTDDPALDLWIERLARQGQRRLPGHIC